MKKPTLRSLWILIGRLSLILAILLMWQFGHLNEWILNNTIFDPFLISTPNTIAQKAWNYTFGEKAGFLWLHLTSTMIATLTGFAVGTLTGLIAGLLLAQARFVYRIINPLIVGVNAVPRIAFAPFILMIFGTGFFPKVVMSWLFVFFIVFFNVIKGANDVMPSVLATARILGATERQITRTVRLPNAIAWTFSAIPNAVAYAFIGVVLQEFLGSEVGIGYILILGMAFLDATDLMVALIVLGILGTVLVSLAKIFERRLLFWKPEQLISR